jgi:hypothetical protein
MARAAYTMSSGVATTSPCLLPDCCRAEQFVAGGAIDRRLNTSYARWTLCSFGKSAGDHDYRDSRIGFAHLLCKRVRVTIHVPAAVVRRKQGLGAPGLAVITVTGAVFLRP